MSECKEQALMLTRQWWHNLLSDQELLELLKKLKTEAQNEILQ